MIEDLLNKKCVPCRGGMPNLAKETAAKYLADLRDWRLSQEGSAIRAEYLMKDFSAAVELIAEIAKIAEAEDHHPDFHLTAYRKLTIELSTHAIGGLSENDFILAAKIESLPKRLKV